MKKTQWDMLLEQKNDPVMTWSGVGVTIFKLIIFQYKHILKCSILIAEQPTNDYNFVVQISHLYIFTFNNKLIS